MLHCIVYTQQYTFHPVLEKEVTTSVSLDKCVSAFFPAAAFGRHYNAVRSEK